MTSFIENQVNFMKKQVLFIIPFIITVLFSCIEEKSTPKIFPLEKYIEAKAIPFEYIIDRIDCTIVDDCIIFQSDKVDTFIHVYSLPEIDHILSFGTKGQGPDEFILPHLIKNNSNMLCYAGYSNPDLTNCFSIDKENKTITKLKDYHIKDVPFYEIRNQVIINDSVLFYIRDIPYSIQIFSYDIHEEKTISQSKIKVKENHPRVWAYFNIGLLIANSQTVVYAYLYQDKISFMNHDLSKKQIVKKKSKVYIDKGMDMNSICYYMNGVAGKEKFYFLYVGDFLKDVRGGAKKKSIEVFDNMGNPLIKYYIDEDITDFVVDENNNKIYAYGYDDDVLLVYDLDE